MKTIFTLTLLSFLIACDSKKKSVDNEEEKTELLGTDAELVDGQRVFFKNLTDGEEVHSPIHIEMGVEGMEIEPAGELAYHKGHHHIFVNDQSLSKGTVVQTDSTHIHFGKGQVEADLDLPPGDYTITLQFADGFHRSYGAQMSESIKLTVVNE